MTDWRLPENRHEALMRTYLTTLQTRSHPGCVYSLLPAIADHYGLDDRGRRWLAWLNGNTQNPVTSMLLLDAAPDPVDWRAAVEFWDKNFTALEWDMDRRHQKSRFADATDLFIGGNGEVPRPPSLHWPDVWRWARGLPYLGRLSAWSFIEFNRILLGPDAIPDADTLMLEDKDGSRSHRNGLCLLAGAPIEAAYWRWDDVMAFTGGTVEPLEELASAFLQTAQERSGYHPDVSRLTLESVLCSWKSWHKPRRRYTGVYADMAYMRIKKAESRFPDFDFGPLWAARQRDLPAVMRLEDNPGDPGMVPEKQNEYLEYGNPTVLPRFYDDMASRFDVDVQMGAFGARKEK